MAGKVTTWFGGKRGYLQRIGLRRDGLILHSLRHSGITKMDEARVSDTSRTDLTGHARQGDQRKRTYIKGSIPRMLHELSMTDYTQELSRLPDLREMLK